MQHVHALHLYRTLYGINHHCALRGAGSTDIIKEYDQHYVSERPSGLEGSPRAQVVAGRGGVLKCTSQVTVLYDGLTPPRWLKEISRPAQSRISTIYTNIHTYIFIIIAYSIPTHNSLWRHCLI